MRKLIFTYSLLFIPYFFVFAQNIYTVAGNHAQGYSGDGGPATAAEFFYPEYVIFDGSGNYYISDYGANDIRMVNTSGIISTIAGIPGKSGFSGDGGLATAAELFGPSGLAFDAAGNLYIADETNDIIRKINTTGVITTIAGIPKQTAYSGDGGPAADAELNGPTGISFDNSGNLYIADYFHNVIRKVNTSGIISTVAGNGKGNYCCDGSPATDAELDYPINAIPDNSGNLLISDNGNNIIRMVNDSGIISTVSGIPAYPSCSGDGGPASAAELAEPEFIEFGVQNNYYISDPTCNKVLEVNSNGIIFDVGGNGSPGYNGDGGPSTAAELDAPYQAVYNSDNLYIADEHNYVIRKITNINSIITGINQWTTDNGQLTIFPNPAKDKITIKWNHPSLMASTDNVFVRDDLTVEVFDISGQKQMEQKCFANSQYTTLNIQNLSNEWYLSVENDLG